ncbi:MAG: ABC transporter ATP-binding protein [Gallionellaceae bacterium]|nr:ABC transporter ATP-binding protein [Gallionellaceae bacterium]
MSSDVAISVRNLTKTYRLFAHPGDRIKQAMTFGLRKYHKEFTALKDVSFDIRKGETVGIIGRNGSGKSTLLQLICGILKPTSGSVQMNGRVSALLELGAGFNPEFTGRENVYFQGALMGFTHSQMDDRFDEIAAFADIDEFIDQPVRTYSSGMFVRLAFSVAVSVDPDILIVDEALSVGDALFQSKCFHKFHEFKAQGVTILFVTHSLDLVAEHCERGLLLDRGKLRNAGDAKGSIDAYRRLMSAPRCTDMREGDEHECNAKSASTWLGMFLLNPDEVRYGTRATSIIEAGLFTGEGDPTQLLQHGEECTIKVRVQCGRDSAHPFVSFVIKDIKGGVLCGTTTRMEDVDLTELSPGQVIEVSFRQIMLFNPGHYLLSVGTQETRRDGQIVAHDHRTDYLGFEVVGKSRYGLFAAPIDVSWQCES